MNRGVMLMEVMGAFAIMAVGLVLFALGSIQMSKLFRETYSTAATNALQTDSLNLELRRDERASLAVFSGTGDLALDGATFWGTEFPSGANGADWQSGAAFLADLTAFYADAGYSLAVNPNTPVEQNSWLLFLGPNGRLTAYYRFHNLETPDGNGGTNVDTMVERYIPLSPVAASLTLTYRTGITAPGHTLALLMASLGHAYVAEEHATSAAFVSLPSAFLGGDALYDRTGLWLEAREVSPRTLSIRPCFQP